jgi:hypothetical protein
MKNTLLLLALFAVPAFAQSPFAQSHREGECTRNDIVGVYGFSGQGFVVADGVGFPMGPITTVGTITFKKDGTFQTKQNISANGALQRDVLFSGTYTVRPDCTFSLVDPSVDPNNPSDFGVLMANGGEFLLMPDIEGFAITFSGKRISASKR